METQELKSVIEALIFVAEEPLTEKHLLQIFAEGTVSKSDLKSALAELLADYNDDAARGIQLKQVAGGYQFRTKESCASWLKGLNVPKPVRLSPAALETMAIVAYRQPCIRSEIEDVRGVDSGGVIKTLIERGLVKIIGRRDEAGQPLLYGTTKQFLELFDLKELCDLPSLKEIQEVMSQKQVNTEENSQTSFAGMSTDEDESTEVIDDDDDEEPTEVIEDSDEDSDDEDIASLEVQLKDIRKLEKNIFSHPLTKQPRGGDSEGKSPNQEELGEKHKSSETTERKDQATSQGDAASQGEIESDDSALH